LHNDSVSPVPPDPFTPLIVAHARMLKCVESLRDLLHAPWSAASAAAVDACLSAHIAEHHRIEEEDLFPLLIEASVARDKLGRMMALIETLTLDHRDMERIWLQLRPAIVRVSGGRRAVLDSFLVDCFAALQVIHVANEETVLFPLARTTLSGIQLAALTRRIRRGRGAVHSV